MDYPDGYHMRRYGDGGDDPEDYEHLAAADIGPMNAFLIAPTGWPSNARSLSASTDPGRLGWWTPISHVLFQYRHVHDRHAVVIACRNGFLWGSYKGPTVRPWEFS